MIEEEIQDFNTLSVQELFDLVDESFGSVPDKRKKKELNAWKVRLNELISITNKKAGHTVFKKVK